MNIEDIFPEIYNRIVEEKQDFGADTVAKNIMESPYFEYIKHKMVHLKERLADEKTNANGVNTDKIIRNYLTSGILLHGSSRKVMGKDLKLLSFKERTETKDTSMFIHNYVNNLAKKEYGFKVRNGMFVVSKFKNASSFGLVYAIFPIGAYKIFYTHGTVDFTDEFSTAKHDEFGAHFTSYLLIHALHELEGSRVFNQNVNDDAGNFLHHVGESLNDEEFENFSHFKTRFMQAAEEQLQESIDNHDNFDEVLNAIKRAINLVVKNYMSHLRQYVKNIEETQDPQNFLGYEGMMFFKDAYAIEYESDMFVEVILAILEKI